PSRERIGSNETMASRGIDETTLSSKFRIYLFSLCSLSLSQKSNRLIAKPEVKPKTPIVTKMKLSRKKEEEVRRWNAAIAKGNVFRPRKDDETID
ncbi:hypothetical protein PENTCL1PPCAC_27645, partial [Pristionchus entomophagus]